MKSVKKEVSFRRKLMTAVLSVTLPLIALLSTILIGWVKSPKYVADEMERGGYKFRRKRMYYVMIRYVAPVMMLVLFLQSTGCLLYTSDAADE